MSRSARSGVSRSRIKLETQRNNIVYTRRISSTASRAAIRRTLISKAVTGSARLAIWQTFRFELDARFFGTDLPTASTVTLKQMPCYLAHIGLHGMQYSKGSSHESSEPTKPSCLHRSHRAQPRSARRAHRLNVQQSHSIRVERALRYRFHSRSHCQSFQLAN